MLKTSVKKIDEIGIDYKSYKNTFIRQVENPNKQDEQEMKYLKYRKMNLQRTRRLDKYFVPSDELINVVKTINQRQTWMVITESWCGDSAQNLPIITKAASLNEKINICIVLRDENLEIMDRYLTNGSRSIPKLVVFDKDSNELFQWGPRPVEAQNIYMKFKESGMEKSAINEELHLWYGINRGKEVEIELVELLKSVNKKDKN